MGNEFSRQCGNLGLQPKFPDAPTKLTITTGVVDTICGNPGWAGYADGIAKNAFFYNPNGISYDSQTQQLYVVDHSNRQIRVVHIPQQQVSTLRLSSNLKAPLGCTYDAQNHALYIVDNNSIRKAVVPETTNTNINGKVTISLFAGSNKGRLGHRDGAASSSSFYNPQNLIVDSKGTLYMTQLFPSIRLITSQGQVNTINVMQQHQLRTDFSGIALDPSGNHMYVSGLDHCIYRISMDGTQLELIAGTKNKDGYQDGPALQAKFNAPSGLAMDNDGNLYIADSGNHCIRMLNKSGLVISLAGHPSTIGHVDGEGRNVAFNKPTGIVWDKDHRCLYVSDLNNHCIRRVHVQDSSMVVPQGSNLITTQSSSSSSSTSSSSSSLSSSSSFSSTFLAFASSSSNLTSPSSSSTTSTSTETPKSEVQSAESDSATDKLFSLFRPASSSDPSTVAAATESSPTTETSPSTTSSPSTSS